MTSLQRYSAINVYLPFRGCLPLPNTSRLGMSYFNTLCYASIVDLIDVELSSFVYFLSNRTILFNLKIGS